jgi:hypothetical protein
MRDIENDAGRSVPRASAGNQPLVVRVAGDDFQCLVLQKLARLEAKMDMLAGGMQPGRMKLAEDRLIVLERNDIKNGVYTRLLSAVIAFVVSVVIAMHDHIFK